MTKQLCSPKEPVFSLPKDGLILVIMHVCGVQLYMYLSDCYVACYLQDEVK